MGTVGQILTIPLYAIVRTSDVNEYLRSSNGQPFQSISKVFLEIILDEMIADEMKKEWQVALIERVPLGEELKKEGCDGNPHRSGCGCY